MPQQMSRYNNIKRELIMRKGLGPCRDATLDLLTKALLNMLRYQTKIIEAVVEKAGKVLLIMPPGRHTAVSVASPVCGLHRRNDLCHAGSAAEHPSRCDVPAGGTTGYFRLQCHVRPGKMS
jgi:hypothetical protein